MVFGALSISLAYIGPGPGLTMLWALIALVGTVLSAVVALLFFPIRVLLRRRRNEAEALMEKAEAVPATVEAAD